MQRGLTTWLSRGVASAAIVAVCTNTAAAAPDAAQRRLLVAQPAFDGSWRGLSPSAAAAAARNGLEGLDGFSVLTDDDAACETDDCWRQRTEAVEAVYVLSSHISVVDRDVELRMEVLDGDSGRVLASAESSCEVCASNEVREMLTAQAALLRPRIEKLLVRPSLLVVDSRPTGAKVFVDGAAQGTTPLQLEVAPGTHDVVVRAQGRRTARIDAQVEEGKTAAYDLDLVQRAPPPRLAAADATAPPKRGLTYGGVASLGAGAGALATSIALLVIDGRPQSSSCPPSGPDDGGRCPRMYDTRAGGFVALGVAISGIVVGTVLLVLSRRR